MLAAAYRQDTCFSPKAYRFAPDPLSSLRSPLHALYRTFVGVRLHLRERGELGELGMCWLFRVPMRFSMLYSVDKFIRHPCTC